MKVVVSSYICLWVKELGKLNVCVVGIVLGIMEEMGLCILVYEEVLVYIWNIFVE